MPINMNTPCLHNFVQRATFGGWVGFGFGDILLFSVQCMQASEKFYHCAVCICLWFLFLQTSTVVPFFTGIRRVS